MKVEELNIQDAAAVADYERGFYRGFIKNSNPGIRAIWHWDDEGKRLRTLIPYQEQKILYVRDENGEVSTGVALNVGLKAFQSEEYGFARPPDDHKWFEILVVFNVGRGSSRALFGLFQTVHDWMKAEGYVCYYATSAKRALAWHKRIGTEILDERESMGVVRYFLRQDRAKMKFDWVLRGE